MTYAADRGDAADLKIQVYLDTLVYNIMIVSSFYSKRFYANLILLSYQSCISVTFPRLPFPPS